MSKFSFGKRSEENLKGVHPDLVRVLRATLALGIIDFAVTDGVRTVEQQERLYAQGRTTEGPIVTWTMNSKHLPRDSGWGHAVDIVPYPVDYNDIPSFFLLAGVIMAVASQLGVDIKWGGFWDSKDYPHFEIVL